MPPKPIKRSSQTREPWDGWQGRVRAHMKAHGISWPNLAERMDMEGTSGSGIRHWINGTRNVNLADLFALCKAIEADPAVILFGGPCIDLRTLDPDAQDALRAIMRMRKT